MKKEKVAIFSEYSITVSFICLNLLLDIWYDSSTFFSPSLTEYFLLT